MVQICNEVLVCPDLRDRLAWSRVSVCSVTSHILIDVRLHFMQGDVNQYGFFPEKLVRFSYFCCFAR